MALLSDVFDEVPPQPNRQQTQQYTNQNTDKIFNKLDKMVKTNTAMNSGAHLYQSPPVETQPVLPPLKQHQPQQENFDNYDARIDNLNKQIRDLQELNDKQNGNLWDTYASKRKDVLKLLMFGLVIMFALSLNSIIKEYVVEEIIKEMDSSYTVKLLTRLLYPAVAVLLIWSIKIVK